MRTIDATLKTALATGHFTPYIKLRVYRNGTLNATLPVTKYKLTGTHLSVTVRDAVVISATPDSIKVILDRGITSLGTNYLLSTSKFSPLTGQVQRIPSKSLFVSTSLETSLIPPKYVSFDAYTSYENAISQFCTAIGKTYALKNPSAAWWSYSFLPVGSSGVTFNNANNFLSLLRQKYFIFATDNGGEEILFYHAFDIPALADAQITPITL